MLLQVETSALIKAFDKMPAWMIFIILLVLVGTYIYSTFKTNERNKENSSLLRSILETAECSLELEQNKVSNILNLQGTLGIIDRYYSNSKLEIQGMLSYIYFKNNIHDPERKKDITENVTSQIKNLYKRDLGMLVIFRYKTKQMSYHLEEAVQPEVLIDVILTKLFKDGAKNDDMMKYIDNTFNKYILDSQKYYENL